MMSQLYPQETLWWPTFTQEVNALYAQAGQATNDKTFMWYTRTAYDIGAGLTAERSSFIHQNELRQALGLPVVPDPVVVLPKLVQNGQFFALETGECWTAVECSDFNLFGRYLDGEDITPILTQRSEIGYNLLRVWTLYNLEASNIGKLTLNDHPDLYDKICQFCQLCARCGLYVEFTAYTDILDTNHWLKLGSALQGQSNVLLEFANERHAPPNWESYQPIPGILCSHGSGLSEDFPMRPWWQYETMHFNDAYEWNRKIGHNAMEMSVGAEGIPASHVPILSNENTRFSDKDNNPIHAYDAAAGAALLCSGSCFHSRGGKNSTLWSGLELECAQAWANGAKSVPLKFQPGSYIHRTELEGPNDLRAYERRLSSGEGYIVKIRK